jgi:hypothetical protein
MLVMMPLDPGGLELLKLSLCQPSASRVGRRLIGTTGYWTVTYQAYSGSNLYGENNVLQTAQRFTDWHGGSIRGAGPTFVHLCGTSLHITTNRHTSMKGMKKSPGILNQDKKLANDTKTWHEECGMRLHEVRLVI